MRKLVERLIYHKWFYAFLALALWIDTYTDLLDFLERGHRRDVVSLVLSVAGALLLTVIVVDLHLRWPAARE